MWVIQVDLGDLAADYARLRAELGRTDWLCQGYAQERGPGAGGAVLPMDPQGAGQDRVRGAVARTV